MKNELLPLADVKALIEQGRILLLAGEEELLRELPKGTWIGGTSSNFMTEEGGLTSQDRIFTTDITDIAAKTKITAYDRDSLHRIGAHYPVRGFTFLLIPGSSELHRQFAREVQGYTGIETSPLIGWIAGVHPKDIGKKPPKVFSGTTDLQEEQAIAIHVSLPPGVRGEVRTVNLFEADPQSPALTFEVNSFEVEGLSMIGGAPKNLAAYIEENHIDTKLPLVSTSEKIKVNVSIQSVNAAEGTVAFYAPVFRGNEYRFAKRVENYTEAFNRILTARAEENVSFSCNCILNYLYGNLEGKHLQGFYGPITFGEIAYRLLNQTLVYLVLLPIDPNA